MAACRSESGSGIVQLALAKLSPTAPSTLGYRNYPPPLIIEFHKIFLRQPVQHAKPPEHGWVFTAQDLRTNANRDAVGSSYG